MAEQRRPAEKPEPHGEASERPAQPAVVVRRRRPMSQAELKRWLESKELYPPK
jgi:hypothetical protein